MKEKEIIKSQQFNIKKILLGIGVLLAICLIIGVSYAYWRLTLHQLGRNEVTSGCLELILSKEGECH